MSTDTPGSGGSGNVGNGESLRKRKWWHCTLYIKNRENNNTLSTITSVSSGNPIVNANPDSILAYSSNSGECSSVEVPVPSFDENKSSGYFLVMPSLEELGESIVDINTYQDAINLNNRRIFQFIRTAAYHPSNCEAQSPLFYDFFEYEKITNDLSSNVFRYPQIPLYSKIGCCQVELLVPSTDLPPPGIIGRATRIWYITSALNTTTNTREYSLYSYDYALLSGALAFRGKIDCSIAPDVTLYDITWIPVDNTLLVISNEGIRRIYPGSQTSKAILGDRINIDTTGLNASTWIFPISDNDAQIYSPKIEYNLYDNSLYVFYPLSTGLFGGSSAPAYIKMEYSERVGIKYISHAYINANFNGNYRIGGLAYPSNYSTTLQAYCLLGDSLANITSSGEINKVEPLNNLFAGLETLAFVEDPDNSISGQVLYTSNPAGQLFRINIEQATPINTGYTLGASPVGSATSINGEDTRISPFPFALGKSHWLFLVDISASMSGQRIKMIMDSFRGMMRTYVRYNDKITIIGFNDKSPIRISKELKTYTDTSEILSYLETFFIPSGTSTNFCSVISNLSTQFNNLKNIFILSDGTFDDCGSSSNFSLTVKPSLDAIVSSNPGVVITSVGVATSSTPPVLQYISSSNYGPYVDWR